MFKRYQSKIYLFSTLALTAGTASAEIPPEASGAVSGLVTDATAFVASFWPLLIGVTVAFTFMKIFKKGTSKAT